jgi:hypothetical protein
LFRVSLVASMIMVCIAAQQQPSLRGLDGASCSSRVRWFFSLTHMTVLALDTGDKNKATMLLDDSKTATTLVTPAARVLVKDVKDARKLQSVLDKIKIYTNR